MEKQQLIISNVIGWILYIISMYLIIDETSWRVGVGIFIFTVAFKFMSDTNTEYRKGKGK